MVFNPRAVNDGYFAPNAISETWGGERDFAYDHDVYWSALERMCAERRTVWMERWRALGGTVGIREWDYKVEPPHTAS